MLEFFRKYQRYFFIFITIIIVISFSFFGTYSGLSDGSFREQIAFTAVDGTEVTRRELDEMALFLGTDAHDKLLFGGSWGANFLNDGVIKKDFLETGLGTVLTLAYPDEVMHDLEGKQEKEKRYKPYAHPQARFIGMEAIWNNFAPEMGTYFQMLRSAETPVSQSALQARTALFLMERQIPAPLLRQLMRYQEKQYNWVKPDPQLDYTDLSLFGYHTIEDWFGPRFMRLASEFIMNAAAIAEQKGYEVTKADALADLMRNAEISFRQNAQNPSLGVNNSHEYFNEQLRRMGLDHNMAAKLWRQVLLFRRLFQDMGSSVFVDSYTFQKLDDYAGISVEGVLYSLPKELRLGNYRALQKFEVYLDAVSKRSEEEKSRLKIPTTFLSTSEVEQKYPELVQKRYLLEVAQIDKKSLEGNISVKDSWNWETSDRGWEQLKKQFPELATKGGKTRDERFTALDSLDAQTRSRLDAFARSAIVDEHPEWIDEALKNAQAKQLNVGLHDQGLSPDFAGLENGKMLMKLLDGAPLNAQPVSADPLARFSADKNNYYRIKVLARSPKPEILTFAQAEQQGALDKVLDRILTAYYVNIREANTKEFQREDKSWKPLNEVKDAIADRYFEKVLQGIQREYAAAIAPEVAPQTMIGDYAATLRLYPYVKEVKNKIEKNPALASELIRENVQPTDEKNSLVAQGKLSDQWKLDRRNYQVARSSNENALDKTELFSLAKGAWTKVSSLPNGEINFFLVERTFQDEGNKIAMGSLMKARYLLEDSAQRHLMIKILQKLKESDAISLAYLNNSEKS